MAHSKWPKEFFRIGRTPSGHPHRLHPDPTKRRKTRTKPDLRLAGKRTAKPAERFRQYQDKWSASKGEAGWRIFYPRDLDLDGPSNRPGPAPPPSARIQHREPLPPPDDAPAASWAAWEAEELRTLARRPDWARLSASSTTSAGLRKRARLVRLVGGRPLVLVARASGLSTSVLSRYLRGRAVPSFASARRIARALGVSLEELGRYLDRVRSDPF